MFHLAIFATLSILGVVARFGIQTKLEETFQSYERLLRPLSLYCL